MPTSDIDDSPLGLVESGTDSLVLLGVVLIATALVLAMSLRSAALRRASDGPPTRLAAIALIGAACWPALGVAVVSWSWPWAPCSLAAAVAIGMAAGATGRPLLVVRALSIVAVPAYLAVLAVSALPTFDGWTFGEGASWGLLFPALCAAPFAAGSVLVFPFVRYRYRRLMAGNADLAGTPGAAHR